MTSWLLSLYPAAWRERYGNEMIALLAVQPLRGWESRFEALPFVDDDLAVLHDPAYAVDDGVDVHERVAVHGYEIGCESG
jgi:hypothetical protein